MVNIATFLFIGILWISIHYSPMFKSLTDYLRDFDFTDLYFSDIRKENQLISKEVFIVNSGNLGRIKLAEQINTIQKFNPAVIGVEYIPEEKGGFEDYILRDALNKHPNIVMSVAPVYQDNEVISLSKPNPFFGELPTGNIEFVTNPPTIRIFQKQIIYNDTIINSFAEEVLKIYNPQKLKSFNNRKNNTEIINYKSGAMPFIIFDYEYLEDSAVNLSIIEDKIVLLGYLKRYQDAAIDTLHTYFTPVERSQYGHPDFKRIEIHANIINMILEDKYIDKLPLWANVLIAFIIGYIFIIFLALYYKTGAKYFDLVTKPAMFGMIILNLWVTILIFGHYNLKIDLVLASIVLVICIEIFRFYEETLIMLKIRSYLTERCNFEKDRYE
jgi:CHASE2 domain-containing sensor protein